MQSYVVVAPIRSTESTGHIARNLLRSLRLAGAGIGAIDTRRPNEENVAGELDDLGAILDAPVRLRGATVVHHAPLRDLARSLTQHPTPMAKRRVAYIDWPLARFEEQDLEILLPFDEVWVTTHFQRELLTASGLPRGRVHVVHPGVDASAPWSAIRETAEVYVSNDTTNAFPLACLDAMARGVPVAAIDPLGTSELVDVHTAVLIGRTASAADVEKAQQLVANARQRARELCDLAVVGRSVLERESSPLRAAPGLLANILSQLGLKLPADWLAGSRSRVVLCSVAREHDDWRTPLQRFLAQHGPNDDVTLCLWIDTELAPLLESLAAEIQTEIDRAQGAGGPGDVLLLSAPLEHVPWDRVALEAAA